jgi:hypothetical protein
MVVVQSAMLGQQVAVASDFKEPCSQQESSEAVFTFAADFRIHLDRMKSTRDLQIPKEQSDTKNAGQDSVNRRSRLAGNIFNFLNMAGMTKSNQFHPLTQSERNQLYFRTMVNPLGFLKAGFSAGIDQANDKPREWEQGGSGYGKRFGNILAQYSIQRTISYALGSALHEDNRYFNSGKQGFWPRTGYALTSGILARHDDGSRHLSVSQVGGVAAGAFLSRAWLPPSQNSLGDAAVSFGITMGSNAGFGLVKEFIPDVLRRITRKH